MGDIVKGIFGGRSAAKGAAAAQVAGAEEGAVRLEEELTRGRELLDPFARVGEPALQAQMALTGLAGPEEQEAALAGLVELPGQRFIRERAQKGLLRGASALGGIGGGNVRTALLEQSAGFAQQDLINQFNRLAGLTQTGFGATTGIAELGANTAQNVANLRGAQGQARASGILGAQQARSQMVGQLVQLGTAAAGGFGGFGGGAGGFTASPFAAAPSASSVLGGTGQFAGLAA